MYRSDVWSFGVLTWEVYSNCIEPYQQQIDDYRRPEALRAFIELGSRLEKPNAMPEALDIVSYTLMLIIIFVYRNFCYLLVAYAQLLGNNR